MDKPRLDQGQDYERGFIDGMSKQAQSSVDKAVNAMAQPAPPPPECKTVAEQTAYAFGWWKALEYVRTEQPAQEPVAWMTINEYGEEDDIHYENPEGHLMEGWTYKPLYTTPQPAKAQEPLEYWNAVEGWVKIEEVREHFGSVGCGTIYKTAGEDRIPLYINPQQRLWVGLTDEEASWCQAPSTIQTWKRIEAKLKEKNNV